MRATLTSIKQRGPWDVPPRLTVQAMAGGVELDFTEARLQDDQVEIDLDVVAGSVEMRVPLGSRIDHSGLALTLFTTTPLMPTRTLAGASVGRGPTSPHGPPRALPVRPSCLRPLRSACALELNGRALTVEARGWTAHWQ